MSTPRYKHEPIKMCFRQNDESLIRLGDFHWLRGETGKLALAVMIPGGADGQRNVYSRWTIGHKNQCGAQWGWDGNDFEPTLTPSLHAVGIWHGWARNGYLVEA